MIDKNNFLSKKATPEDKEITNDIWAYYSNLDSYIQMNKSKDRRTRFLAT